VSDEDEEERNGEGKKTREKKANEDAPAEQ
jgi:hypothetical protein